MGRDGEPKAAGGARMADISSTRRIRSSGVDTSRRRKGAVVHPGTSAENPRHADGLMATWAAAHTQGCDAAAWSPAPFSSSPADRRTHCGPCEVQI